MSFKEFLGERNTQLLPAKQNDSVNKGHDPYNTAKKRVPLRVRAMKLAQKSGVDPRNSVDAQAKKYKQVYRDNPGVKEEVEVVNEVKVGDHVHLGHATKGGAGYRGHVIGVEGNTVHVQQHDHDAKQMWHGVPRTWKGHLKNVTVEKGIKEEVESLDEMMPLRGHPYHTKPDSHLHYIMKDAHAAAKAMQNHDQKAHMKYLDQVNDAATVLHFRQKGGKRVTEEVSMVNEKIVNSKESLEKAIHAAERRAAHAKAEQEKKRNTSYLEALKSALRRIKGKKKLSAKDIGSQPVSTSEETEKHEPSHKEEGKSKRAARFKYKKKFDKQNESTETLIPLTELSKKVLGSYRKKALSQLKAGKGELKGKEVKRFNGVAKSVKE